DKMPGGSTSDKCTGCDGSCSVGRSHGGEGTKITTGRSRHRIRLILAERRVDEKRLPVEFRHIGRHIAASERWRGSERYGRGIRASKTEGESGLWIIKPHDGARRARQPAEGVGRLASHCVHEGLVCRRLRFPEVVMRKRLRKTRPFVGIPRLVAVRSGQRPARFLEPISAGNSNAVGIVLSSSGCIGQLSRGRRRSARYCRYHRTRDQERASIQG